MISKISALLLTLISFQLLASGQQTYRLDTNKSTLRWNSGEVGHHFGHIKLRAGSLLFSKEGKPVSGTFVIDMRTIKSTDNRDEAKNLESDATMMKPNFFDVANYPESKIIITEIVKIVHTGYNLGAGSPAVTTYYRVQGSLTIKGTTHPLEFTAAIDPKDNIVNIQADIELHRGWWGIDYKGKPQSQDLLFPLPKKMETDQVFVQLNLVLRK